MDWNTLPGLALYNSWLLSVHRGRNKDRGRKSLGIQQSRPGLWSLDKRANLAGSSEHLDRCELSPHHDGRLSSKRQTCSLEISHC